MTAQSREQETRRIHRRYADFYKISGGLTLVIVGIWIGSLLFSDGYATNVYTEILSVIATIAVLDRINQWRDTQNLKKRLIREAGSQSNETAKAAIDWMRAENWLTVDDDVQLLKGSTIYGANLQGANFRFADLHGANFRFTNLMGADLVGANLQETDFEFASFHGANLWNAKLTSAYLGRADLINVDLSGASLQDADLQGADLTDADLRRANFKGADLSYANLEGADLRSAHLNGTKLEGAKLQSAKLWDANFAAADLANANLQGANLENADLQYASLLNANLQGGNLRCANLTHAQGYMVTHGKIIYTATLPDGTTWTPETDMRRFTDPDHPDFWQPPSRDTDD